MEQQIKPMGDGKKRVFVRSYTTSAGRTVPDHYRATPYTANIPKGTFLERRLLNPKIKRY
jgi:hypothetical protein